MKLSTRQARLIAAVRTHAVAHYDSDGWDYVVEAMTDDELAQLIGAARTESSAIRRVGAEMRIYRDHHMEIAGEAERELAMFAEDARREREAAKPPTDELGRVWRQVSDDEFEGRVPGKVGYWIEGAYESTRYVPGFRKVTLTSPGYCDNYCKVPF